MVDALTLGASLEGVPSRGTSTASFSKGLLDFPVSVGDVVVVVDEAACGGDEAVELPKAGGGEEVDFGRSDIGGKLERYDDRHLQMVLLKKD